MNSAGREAGTIAKLKLQEAVNSAFWHHQKHSEEVYRHYASSPPYTVTVVHELSGGIAYIVHTFYYVGEEVRCSVDVEDGTAKEAFLMLGIRRPR